MLVVGGYFGVPAVVDLVVRGARLTDTSDHSKDADGNPTGDWSADDMTVIVDPETLAEQAAAVVGQSVGVDEYAAARMCRSEEGRQTDFVKRCLIQTAINDAQAHGWTLLHTLTVSSVASRSGFFGHQRSRRYSTAEDPYDGDLAVARQAIADHAAGTDDAQGAQKFVNKWSFTGDNTYDATAAAWAKDGFSPFTIDGVPSHIVFFRRG